MSDPCFIELAFPVPLDRTFHYRVPNGQSAPSLGSRVLAPFGKTKNLVGYIVGHTDKVPPFQTKEILAVIDPVPFIDKNLLDLARWVSDRYLCSLGEALASIVPPNLAPPKRPRSSSSSPAVAGGGTIIGVPTDAMGPRQPRPPVEVLNRRGSPVDEKFDGWSGQGHSGATDIRLTSEQENALKPILAAAEAKRFQPFLLHGITDSGKTEIYLRTIDCVLAQRRQALYLLPEIALTPPFADRLRQRYGEDRAAVWHSGISGGERYRIWAGVHSGQIHVLLGARSAVFAPFQKMGLIVMDEEHEPSYKQEDRPRYHTRDVALKRAEQTGSVLIMGSATPSLESYWKAEQGTYTLLEMASRVEARQLPPVTLIDRRPHQPDGGGETGEEANLVGAALRAARTKSRVGSSSFSVFSEELRLAIEQRLARREQIMLFVNRRGFTPFLRCSTCGWVARCSRCSTTLTLHIREERVASLTAASEKDKKFNFGVVPADTLLQCHACQNQGKAPTHCPSCKGMRLRNFGIGTQKVEQEILRLYPFVKLARLDRDIASSRRVFERVYRDFASGRLDVLVGTQMIAKGFDFPNVTLVGVVDADVSLHLPDFRSSERTFQLIAQVAGRAGRGKEKSRVLVQTHHPDHAALRAAQSHDYLSFYKEELKVREAFHYPPYAQLVCLLIRGTKEPLVKEAADSLADQLQKIAQAIEILGPGPAPYSRIRNQFRYQILLKGDESRLAPVLKFLKGYKLAKAFLTIDVDPADLL
jgi:primosomal protein N' (replication factor Y) (superfamily II helicase)